MAQQSPNVYTFPRMEPGTLGHLDLVEPLRALPSEAAAAVKGLLPAQLLLQPDEGGWSIQEVIGHLADAAAVYHKRLYMMSTQADPILEPYDPDELAIRNGYRDAPVEDLLGKLAYWREETVTLLTTLVNWNWARTGRHLERGRASIRQLVEHMVEHEADHLAQIRRLHPRP